MAILFAAIFLTMSPALDWLQANAAKIGNPTPGIYFAGTGALSSVLDNAPTYLTFLGIIISTSLDFNVLHQAQQFIQSHGADLASITGTHADMVRQVVSAFVQSHPSALLRGDARLEELGICFLLGSPASAKLIAALSIGAVFFGANTYIGNGPNLMVKAIADHQKVHTPGFFGYVIYYALPFMVPMLGIVWWLFFRS